MYHFIESIRVEDGRIPLLDHHQNRMDRTLFHYGKNTGPSLKDLIHVPENRQEGITKCRVIYSLDKVIQIEFLPYQVRKIHSVSLFDIGDRTYPFKFSDRAWIEDVLRKSGTEEVIMHQKGRITDASYANLVFLNGDRWVTPIAPLLHVVRRQTLLLDGIISEEELTTDDLSGFSHVKLINAMMTWEESPVLDLHDLS